MEPATATRSTTSDDIPDRTHFHVDGAWVAPLSTETIAVENPVTEEVLATVPAGTPADVDRAVEIGRAHV